MKNKNKFNKELVLDWLKEEIAQEQGVLLGAETSSYDNGRVGGEITKRLLFLAEEELTQQQYFS